MKIKGEQGASLIEMSLIVSLIAVVGIANVSYFGDRTAAKICESAGKIEVDGSTSQRNRQWNSSTNMCAIQGNSPCPPGTTSTNVNGQIICVALPDNW